MPQTSPDKALAALLLRFADIERRLCHLEAAESGCTASADGSLVDDHTQSVRVRADCSNCISACCPANTYRAAQRCLALYMYEVLACAGLSTASPCLTTDA